MPEVFTHEIDSTLQRIGPLNVPDEQLRHLKATAAEAAHWKIDRVYVGTAALTDLLTAFDRRGQAASHMELAARINADRASQQGRSAASLIVDRDRVQGELARAQAAVGHLTAVVGSMRDEARASDTGVVAATAEALDRALRHAEDAMPTSVHVELSEGER